MNNKRKKIVAYLHPSIYLQDQLAQHYVESLPTQVRGDFYRQAIICGVALSFIDPRLVNLISCFFNESITAEDVIKLIDVSTDVNQVAAYQSNKGGVNRVKSVISGETVDVQDNTTCEVKQAEKKAIENLSMLKK